jgi:hypothetical protein
MNKKAQIVEILGMILIMGIAIFGTASIYLQKDTLYV